MWKALAAGMLIALLSVTPGCGHRQVSHAEPGDFEPDPLADASIPPPRLPAGTPELLLGDSAHLAAVRDSLARGEPQFKRALAALEADAKTALGIAPVSVMDKQVT